LHVDFGKANAKSAKTEVKSALGIFQKEMKGREDKVAQAHAKTAVPGTLLIPPPALQNPAALFLKANLEYLRQNFKKSIKLLYSASASANPSGGASTGFEHQSLLLNNLGCLHFGMQRYRSAAAYFSKALAECERGRKQAKPAKSKAGGAHLGSLVSTTNECELLYNSGVQLLLMHKPELAFRCFRKSARLLFERPRLWVRMAECCIMLHSQQREEVEGQRRTLVRDVVGAGSRRRLLLPPSSTPPPATKFVAAGGSKQKDEDNGSKQQAGGGSSDGSTPSLGYAVKCLRDALVLCNAAPRGTAATAATVGGAGAGSTFAATASANSAAANGNSSAGGAKAAAAAAAGGGGGSEQTPDTNVRVRNRTSPLFLLFANRTPFFGHADMFTCFTSLLSFFHS
jgi:CCR4-NOT transcription complex subunit 10